MIDSHDFNLTCKRCGTCCRKGGSALHEIDRKLVIDGVITLKDLFTIRPGELVFNQIKNTREPAAEDIVKLKGVNSNNWCCTFYNSNGKSCRIYADRPLECRVLKCWDTRQIESVYYENRLQRKDLLDHIDGIMELIVFHQNRCNPLQLHEELDYPAGQKPLLKLYPSRAIIEGIHWDTRIRQLAQEKAKVTPEQLAFIFGRPIQQVMKLSGWEIRKDEKSQIYLRQIFN